MTEERTRIIYYGDNLDMLRAHIPTESVDLVYLDPPFKSQQQYNLLFRTVKGQPAEAQVRAFTDTWKWGPTARATYDRLMEDPKIPGKVSKMVEAFYQFLGPSDMLAYLVMMTPRLLELHRVLKPTGSLYLHCDPAASHYLKLVLDTVFGPTNFRNEVIWKRANAHNDPRRYGRISDSILYYSRGSNPIWNPQHTPYREGYYESHFKQDTEGRYYRTVPLDAPRHGEGSPALLYEWHGKWPAPSRTWAVKREVMEQYEREGRLSYTRSGTPTLTQYADEMLGVPLQNIWTDIPPVNPQAHERLGYQTQKPLALLKRIIEASSNPGDLVLDPFCGCGTALVAAEELGRSWIGIDITYLAVDVMARRLRDHFLGISFEIEGQPKDEEGARALAEKDRFQFQVWALSLVGAQTLDPDRKGADRGIDGYLPFMEWGGKHGRAIVQVKSGHVGVKEVRDLRGTLEREKTPFALLITLEPPTEPMHREAAEAGSYEVPATEEKMPRLQILTIRQLLQGQRPKVPTQVSVSPMPTAPRLKRDRARQLPLQD